METRNKILYGIAVVCGLIAMILFFNISQKRSEIANINKEIDKENEALKIYESIGVLYDTFGKGTSSYHSSVPFIVLNRGSKKGIPVYWSENKGSVYGNCSSSYISGKWAANWKDNWINYEVSSGNQRGCYQVTFTNNKDSSTFSVLVIVK